MRHVLAALILGFFTLIIADAGLAEVIHAGGTYTTNVTWTNTDPVHVLEGNLAVADGAMLTIEPGCTVRFETGLSITVYGYLNAQGTASEGILFTRRETDDEWSGVTITADAGGILRHCTFEYATRYDGRALYILESETTVEDCTFRYNDNGLYFYQTVGTDLTGANTYLDNNTSALTFNRCTAPTIGNQTILGTSNDGGALDFRSTTGFILDTGNVFTGNTWAVGMDFGSSPDPASYGRFPTSGNTNNDGLRMGGGNLSEYVIWPDVGVAYVMVGNSSVGGSARLDITEGAELRFETGISITNYGQLYAEGTSGNPVTFSRRHEDDEWSGLTYSAGSSGILSHAVFEHATRYEGCAVLVNAAYPTISDCLFRDNDMGLKFYQTTGTTLTATNTFTDNLAVGIRFHNCQEPTVDNQVVSGSPSDFGALNFVATTGFLLGTGNTLTGNSWAVSMDMGSAPDAACAGRLPGSGNTNNDGLKVSGGTLTTHTTWPSLETAYVITGNGSIGGASRLDIQAGADLLFENGLSLTIYGQFHANGTAEEGILFSRRHGDDQWSGLTFASGSGGVLRHATFEHATRYEGRAVHVASAYPVIESCLFRDNDHGLSFYQTDATDLTSANTFTDNLQSAVTFQNCTAPVIDNQVMTGTPSSTGALSFTGTTDFLLGPSNTLSGNNWAVGMDLGSSPHPDCQGHIPTSGNTHNDGVQVLGGTLTTSLSWPDLGTAYVLTGIGSINGNGVLTLGPGVVMLAETGRGLTAYGTLNALGTAEDPILFSRRQSTDEWSGLSFSSGSTGNLDHCTIEHVTRYDGRAVYVSGGTVALEACVLTANDHGLYCYNNDISLTNCVIRDNLEYGVYLQGDCGLDLGNSAAQWNDIHDNGGLYPGRDLKNGTRDNHARYVFWGTVSAAAIEERVHHQHDDAGLGLVHISPWLSEDHGTEYTSGPSPVPEDAPPVLPTVTALLGNAPNPFNPATEIRYDLAQEAQVRLDIVDVSGRRVATLVDGMEAAGHKKVGWRPEDLPSGVYFYRLEAGSYRAVGKLTLLK